jgi:hypothetical protein
MVELSPQQMEVIERLFAAGFRPIAIPPFENVLCMRKGECAAILAPVPNDGIRLLATPSYLIDGNLSVKLKRGSSERFVWKNKEVEATAEKLSELESFQRKLQEILDPPPMQ